jgi:2-succinyl-5-enolpyruvyl-6-hydroxy-3-cyclohexene-1-carboxylate synthase
MTNLEVAGGVLDLLKDFGVKEVILCAGARNAPFVHLLSENSDFTVYSFFEERSASFFALGRMQSEGHPVAVVTTSGTAAAELLPAAIEADYQRLPLVMITADRPRRYRGTGAPQTIVQTGIYSSYVEWSCDLEGALPEGFRPSGVRPVHFNVCFDEPLLGAKK